VLRELAAGDRRFTDLKAALVGVTPAVLTARLRVLGEQDLVTTTAGPGARARYALTTRGREATPVLRALARFGMPLLEDPDRVPAPRPWSAVQTCVLAYYDSMSAAGIDERYRFVVDGEVHDVSSVRGGGAPRDPDLTVTCSARTLFAIRQGRTTVRGAETDGDLVIRGPRRALRNLRTIFQL
jgi:DNA-binding HxlR family transcriptional regulator